MTDVHPPLGDKVPRQPKGFGSWLASTLMRLHGWRIDGEVPNEPKLVILGMPHTSNWDGYIAMLAVMAMRLRIAIMIKQSVLDGPLGGLLRSVGFFGVDRSKPKDIVEQIAERMRAEDAFWFCVAPEGTRHGAQSIKSGFYRVAEASGAQIVVTTINYSKKVVTFRKPLRPSGDRAADMQQIIALAATHGVAKRPERLSKPLREYQPQK